MRIWKRWICIVIGFALMLSSGLSTTVYWNSTAAVSDLASNASAWSGGVAPAVGDVVIFNGTSVVPATWDLAINVTSFSINPGYSGAITQTATMNATNGFSLVSDSGAATFNQNAYLFVQGTMDLSGRGTFNQGANVYVNGTTTLGNNYGNMYNPTLVFNWTQAGNFNQPVAKGNIANINLFMVREATTATMNEQDYPIWESITIKANVSYYGAVGSNGQGGIIKPGNLTIDAGQTLTLVTGGFLSIRIEGGARLVNNGIIKGPGTLQIASYADTPNPNNYTVSLGTINAPLNIVSWSTVKNVTISLGTNTTLNSTLNVYYDKSSAYSVTLYSNNTLNVMGVTTVGNKAKMIQGPQAWNLSNGTVLNGIGRAYSGGASIFRQGGELYTPFVNVTASNNVFIGNRTFNITTTNINISEGGLSGMFNNTFFYINGSNISINPINAIPGYAQYDIISINQWLNVSSTGENSAYDLNFTYNDVDLGGQNESLLAIFLHNGTGWNSINSSVDTTLNIVNVSGAKSFGLLAPGIASVTTLWWNKSFSFCRNLTIDTHGMNLSQSIIDYNINSAEWVNQPYNNTIRLINNSCEAFVAGDVLVPSDVWNITQTSGMMRGFNLLFLLNSNATYQSSGNFSIYYGANPLPITYPGVNYSDEWGGNTKNITTGNLTIWSTKSGSFNGLNGFWNGHPITEGAAGIGRINNYAGDYTHTIIHEGSQCAIIRVTAVGTSTATFNATQYVCLGDQIRTVFGNKATTVTMTDHIQSPNFGGGTNTYFQSSSDSTPTLLQYQVDQADSGNWYIINSSSSGDSINMFKTLIFKTSKNFMSGQYAGDPAFAPWVMTAQSDDVYNRFLAVSLGWDYMRNYSYQTNLLLNTPPTISLSSELNNTFVEYTVVYSSPFYEIARDTMKISFNTVYTYTNVKLIYNNTPYTALKFNATTWEYNITTPFMLTDGGSVPFYWNWSRNDGTTNASKNYTQTVNYIYFMSSAVISTPNALEGQSVISYLQIQNYSTLATITSIYLNNSGVLTMGAQTAYNGTMNYRAAFTAPSPPTDVANMSVNWTMNVYYGGLTRYQTVSTSNLLVYKLIITFCGDGNLTSVVYQTYDETTWGYLNYSNYSLKVTVKGGTMSRNFSKSTTNAQNISICIYPSNANYTGDITVYYSNSQTATNTYSQRQWHNYNYRLDNDTKLINVYLINSTMSYQVEIDTRDVNNLLAPNTLVLFQKFNYTDNKFYNMTSIFSGVDAKSTTLLNRYDTPYKLILTDSSGVTLSTYNDYFIVESPTVVRTGTSFTNYVQTFEDIAVICAYNNVTKVLSCNFNDPSHKLTQIRFEVMESGLWGKPVICNETLNNTYSGTFTCDLSTVDAATKGFTYRVMGRIEHSYGAPYLLAHGVIEKSLPNIYGANGVFYAMLIWMAVFFLGMWKAEVAIGLSVLGIFVGMWIGVLNVGTEGGAIFIGGLVVSLVALLAWRMKS